MSVSCVGKNVFFCVSGSEGRQVLPRCGRRQLRARSNAEIYRNQVKNARNEIAPKMHLKQGKQLQFQGKKKNLAHTVTAADLCSANYNTVETDMEIAKPPN